MTRRNVSVPKHLVWRGLGVGLDGTQVCVYASVQRRTRLFSAVSLTRRSSSFLPVPSLSLPLPPWPGPHVCEVTSHNQSKTLPDLSDASQIAGSIFIYAVSTLSLSLFAKQTTSPIPVELQQQFLRLLTLIATLKLLLYSYVQKHCGRKMFHAVSFG